MAFKNFLLVLFVCSTITLSLAKPEWSWIVHDETETGANDVVETAAYEDAGYKLRPCVKPDIRDCKN
jgi:hypothetical protein